MFGLFKKRKSEGDRIAEIIASHVLSNLLREGHENAGEVLSALQRDKFVLGYVMGVSGAAANIAGFKKPDASGHVIGKVLDLLFPEASLTLMNHAISLGQTHDPVFVGAAQSGLREFAHAYTIVLEAVIENNDKPQIELPSLDHYLSSL